MNFYDNPFFLLDASPRDSKITIHEKAENKSFELEEEKCRNAERILLNPQKRLEAEVSWFPGISPKKVKNTLNQIIEDTKKNNYDPNLFFQFDGLSRANAVAFFLSNISDSSNWNQETIENIVRFFCEVTSEIDTETTFCLINEDRIAAGFPAILLDEVVENKLEEQQHYYKKKSSFIFECTGFLCYC